MTGRGMGPRYPRPIASKVSFETRIGFPLAYRYATPRPIFIVAMVTTKGGMSVKAIIRPFNRPIAVPAKQPKRMAAPTGIPLFVIRLAEITPETANTEPTERSIPPV